MEIKFFLENSTEIHESLKDHLERMSSGEAPFFPAMLTLLYGQLARKVFPRSAASGSSLGRPTETVEIRLLLDLPHATRRPGTCKLMCPRCRTCANLAELNGGLYCPLCRRKQKGKKRPIMLCQNCQTARKTPSDRCLETTCLARFTY